MKTPKEPFDLDATLGAWPERRDESRTAAILARLAEPVAGEGEDDLLGAPALAPEPGEPTLAAAREDREKDRASLRAVALLAAELPPSAPAGVLRGSEADEADSGIVDLEAAAKADPGAAARAQTAPLADASLFDEAPPPSLASSLPSIPIVSLSSRRNLDDVASIRAATSAPPPSTPERAARRGVPLYLAGATALAAAAAAFFFLMRAPEAPVATVTTTPVPAASAAAPPAPAEKPGPATSVAMLDTPPPSAPATAAPGADPRPMTAPPAAAPPRAPAAAPSAKAASSAALAAQGPKEPGEEPAPVPAAGNSGSSAMGGVPQRPSQGAISGALGAVLPAARACLGPDDEPARATLVFASTGAAQSVTVTGAGDAEACIKGALTRAKLPPFAEPTYTTVTNVRHP